MFFLKKLRDTREKKLNYRTIFVNNIRPESYTDTEEPLDYVPNKIVTSKV